MISGRIREGLEPNWAKDDSEVAHRSAWPVHKGTGATDSAVTYFEIDPGKRIGRHTHDTGETVLLLAGKGRAVVEPEEREISPGDVVHVPAETPHDVVNEGDDTLELVGFSSPRPRWSRSSSKSRCRTTRKSSAHRIDSADLSARWDECRRSGG